MLQEDGLYIASEGSIFSASLTRVCAGGGKYVAYAYLNTSGSQIQDRRGCAFTTAGLFRKRLKRGFAKCGKWPSRCNVLVIRNFDDNMKSTAI